MGNTLYSTFNSPDGFKYIFCVKKIKASILSDINRSVNNGDYAEYQGENFLITKIIQYKRKEILWEKNKNVDTAEVIYNDTKKTFNVGYHIDKLIFFKSLVGCEEKVNSINVIGDFTRFIGENINVCIKKHDKDGKVQCIIKKEKHVTLYTYRNDDMCIEVYCSYRSYYHEEVKISIKNEICIKYQNDFNNNCGKNISGVTVFINTLWNNVSRCCDYENGLPHGVCSISQKQNDRTRNIKQINFVEGKIKSEYTYAIDPPYDLRNNFYDKMY